jgi:putative transposase
MEASNIRRLKEMEDENGRLKQMVADLSLKHEALKDIVEKSSETSREARAGRLRQKHASA